MSLRATSWAWKVIRTVDLRPASKVVLLALADRHYQETGRCNPSLRALVEWTGLSRRGVQQALDELSEKKIVGVIARRRKDGRKRHDLPNEYRFLRGTVLASPPREGGAQNAPPRAHKMRPLRAKGRARSLAESPSGPFDLVIDADGYLDTADASPCQEAEWGGDGDA